MRRTWLRPVLHAGALGFVFLTPVLGRWGMAATAFAVFLVNALLLPRTELGRSLWREGEPRWNGVLSYPAALTLAFLLFPLDAAVAAWAVMALGDPAAAWAGKRATGWPRVPWNRRKSVAGMLAFASTAWIGASLVTACALPSILGIPRSRLLVDGEALAIYACILATGSLVGAVVESLALGIDDNLPVTLAVGAVLSFPMGA